MTRTHGPWLLLVGEQMLLPTLSLLLASVVPPLLLLLVSLIRTPEWISSSNTLRTWRRTSFLAASTGFATAALFGILVLVTHTMVMLPVAVLTAISTGLLMFISVQSGWTDFTFRKADRWVLRAALVISTLSSGAYMFGYRSETDLWLWLLIFLVSLVVFLIPAVGKSDARVITLVCVAALPVMGLWVFQFGFLLVAALSIIYSMVTAPKGSSIKETLTRKVSVPMVPLIAAPFALLCVVPVFI